MKALSAIDTPFSIQLSFNHVIDNLEQSVDRLKGEKLIATRLLLKEAAQFPELRTGITSADEVEKNKKVISKLLADYFPEVLTLNEIKAVSIPYSDIIFNHSERFKNILKAAGNDFEINIRNFDEHQFYVLSCCLVLNEYYGTQLDFSKPLFYDIPSANGIIKHYRILYNADFLEIVPTDKSVPLSSEDIDLLLNSYDNLELWKEKFPKESYILKGFAIMTLFDATIENAVSMFKEQLLVLNYDGFEQSVESIFRSIFRIPDIRIGFTVFNQEEGKFSVAAFDQKMRSYMLGVNYENRQENVFCVNSYRSLITEKGYFAVSDTTEFYADQPDSYLGKQFLSQDIHSFILAPIIKNNNLLGVLEIVSPRPKELNSINANRLDVVMAFLTDALDRLMSEMQNQVQAYIQDKFTAIHSSVYWKFRAEALRAIYDRGQSADFSINEIVFPELYPLYGQVDIKGSSESRNLSVQLDLQVQVQWLIELLSSISGQVSNSFNEERAQLQLFHTELSHPLRANTEQSIVNYLDNHIHKALRQFTDPAVEGQVQEYFNEADKEKGNFHIYRRKHESSVSMINERLLAIIDEKQFVAQASFPHYYERFKTDGVEHNLYIGASIAPQLAFNIDQLHKLRLWQLRTLCEMEMAHFTLMPELPYPLEVATLILVYSTPTTIRFRMDEKRFDVDGSYNARFEIVKKRLDKAHIKHTEERITEAGKITIVYANPAEEAEYRRYIGILQNENLLDADVESFKVEDLQGVSGLKALRARICRP